MKNTNIINTLSKHLFWDVDKKKIDVEEHSEYIILRVLQYGLYSDWKKIKTLYGIEKIVNNALSMKSIDKKTASFLSLMSGVKRENFSCYTTEQSVLKHWNF